MRLVPSVVFFGVVAIATSLPGQSFVGDPLGVHNLSASNPSGVSGGVANVCGYCHAPHGGQSGLWNQKLTTQTYTLYTDHTSSTEKNVETQPTLGRSSNHCLSCHDGTVAAGNTTAYGQIASGTLLSKDLLGIDMRFTHPFSLSRVPLIDNIDIAQTLQNGTTLDATHSVKLIRGNVQCTSCHDPHIQAKDLYSQNFLVMNSANGALCLACHDPGRSAVGAVTTFNPLSGWQASAHALATDSKITSSTASTGNYGNVAANACLSCHAPHNGQATARILRNFDQADCATCHYGANVSPAPPNVFAEYAKVYTHPFPASPNTTPTPPNVHDAAEAVLLPTSNRHATCADCHNPHASKVRNYSAAPGLRNSQLNVQGVDINGTVLSPVNYQYENCLRCHGQTAPGTTPTGFGYEPLRGVVAGNPYNVIPEFTQTNTSSHPVMHARQSSSPQPSLRGFELNFDGSNDTARSLNVNTWTYCTDCHNSEDNKEFGGSGASGPHGSIYSHLLERNYTFSQIALGAARGSTITNLVKSGYDDSSPSAPYGLCGKCHNLSVVLDKAKSWVGHYNHVEVDGLSCSVCHTAHGIGTSSSDVAGTGLVNFDIAVVAAYTNADNMPSYDKTSKTCNLVCHNKDHDSSTTFSGETRRRVIKKPVVGK